tara:strand:- start:289 stop:552 length:264 start_codon:yes stop_codon:yes gene_type:complete
VFQIPRFAQLKIFSAFSEMIKSERRPGAATNFGHQSQLPKAFATSMIVLESVESELYPIYRGQQSSSPRRTDAPWIWTAQSAVSEPA